MPLRLHRLTMVSMETEESAMQAMIVGVTWAKIAERNAR